jgi:hypothetical protein
MDTEAAPFATINQLAKKKIVNLPGTETVCPTRPLLVLGVEWTLV